MNPVRLYFFLANIFLSFSFKGYFVRRCRNIISDSVVKIIIISVVSGALIAYLTFILSARNPFGISIQNFLPFLYSKLILDEICPFMAFFTVMGQCCINTGMELHACSRRGELEILHIYKVNPVGIYISPFIISSMVLGAIACGGFIAASMSVIFFMVYLFEPGYFALNVEKYRCLLSLDSVSLVFLKTILFSVFASLSGIYFSLNAFNTDKFKVSIVIAVSILLSRASDFLFYWLIN